MTKPLEQVLDERLEELEEALSAALVNFYLLRDRAAGSTLFKAQLIESCELVQQRSLLVAEVVGRVAREGNARQKADKQ